MADIKQIQVGSTIYDIRDDSKAPLASPELTGVQTATTAAAGTNTTQIATTAFVQAAFQANDAMVFKGTIGSSGATVSELPATHSLGWTYKVSTAGTYAGQACEIGDIIMCVSDGTAASNADWTVIQGNTDGVVVGPASSTDAHVVIFNGASGKDVADSGFTIGKSVPADAEFTDTTYTAQTTSIGSAVAGTDIVADDITAWSAGSVPTLGDDISASKISAWNAGSVPTLGEEIEATKISNWNAGSAPTLGEEIAADDITSWSAGTLPAVEINNGILKFTDGVLPSLAYTARSIPNVTSVGAAPSLTKADVSIPNVTSVGSAPSLTKTDVSIPNVTDVGTAPSLTYTEKTIPNISVSSVTVATGITADAE